MGLMVLALAGCSQSESPDEDAVSPSPAPTEAVDDPYERYLELAPEGDEVGMKGNPLSREDAQARAFLGCEQNFAPGTVDAALAEAYRDTVCPD